MAHELPFRLTLASGSTGRRYLMNRAGYAFDVLPADIDEPPGSAFTDPRAMVENTAWLKAAAVAPRVPDGLVIAADTVGWIHGQAVGKPADEADARRILHLLSGNQHELWTGVCLWRRPDDLQVAWQEVSIVEMTLLTEAQIDTYLATRVWQGCSGAYAIQEENDPYVRVVRGSMSNVIGLPMETLESVVAWLAGK